MVFNPFEKYSTPSSIYERISLKKPTSSLVPIDYSFINKAKEEDKEEPTCPSGYKWDAKMNACVPITLAHVSSGSVPAPDYSIASDAAGLNRLPDGATFIGNDGLIHTAGYGEGMVDPHLAAQAVQTQSGHFGNFGNLLRTIGDKTGFYPKDINQGQITTDNYTNPIAPSGPTAEQIIANRQEEAEKNRAQVEQGNLQGAGYQEADPYKDVTDYSFNDGGLVYAQAGLAPEMMSQDPMPMEQPGQPNMPLPMPQQAPMQPNMPSEPISMPKKSFAEKVAAAKAFIENKPASIPATPMPMEQPMMDGQGDGGVYGDVEYSMEELGPDIGPDTVDAKLTPGEAVIPAEAVEANPEAVNSLISQGREIQAMKKGGVAYNYEGGLISSTKAQKLFKRAGDNQELKNKIAYLKSGGMLNPNMMKALSMVEEDMYMQEGNPSVGDFLRHPATGGVGDFIYQTSINPSQASTALSDTRQSLIARQDKMDEAAKEAKKEAETGRKVKSTKIETYTKGVGGSIEYAYKYTYLFEDGTADVDYEDQNGNPLTGIPAGYTLSTETNPAQQDRTTWTKSIDVINRRNQEGLQAANNLKQRAGRVMNLIRNNRADLGNPGTRNSFFRKVVRTGVGLFQGVFDFGLNVDATQGTISQLEQELEAQSVDVLTQMKAKGATFGAMSNAEWEKIQNQIGTVDDTLGAIYARQASFVVLYDVLKKGVDAFNKWQAKQRQASDFSTPVSQFEIEYLDSPEHQASIDEANKKILEAIDYGKSINSGKDQSNKDTGSTQDTSDTGDIVTIYSQEEWDNLPDGTEYYDGNLNNNVVYVKGGV